jgi:hypothetical protein
MGATKSKWRANQLAFFDGTTHETVKPVSPIDSMDDFFGTAVNGDLWAQEDTNNATKAIAASALTFTMTNTDQIQDAGIYGANIAADTDWFVLSTDMQNAAYTLEHTTFPGGGIGFVTVTQTKVGNEDTNGKITIVGTDRYDAPQTEDIIPNDGATVPSANMYKTITSLTGSGWVVDAGVDIDHVVLGCSAVVSEFDPASGLIIETRLAVTTTPSGLAELEFGFSGDTYTSADRISEGDSIDFHACFIFDMSTACLIFTDDDLTDNDTVATGHVCDGNYHIYRIDMTDLADVQFFVDGERVASGTTFDMSNLTVASAKLVPYFMAVKASGNGECVYKVDYIKVWANSR